MVRRWHADPFGLLRPWGEVPALFGSAPPATPPHRTGVVTFRWGSFLDGRAFRPAPLEHLWSEALRMEFRTFMN